MATHTGRKQRKTGNRAVPSDGETWKPIAPQTIRALDAIPLSAFGRKRKVAQRTLSWLSLNAPTDLPIDAFDSSKSEPRSLDGFLLLEKSHSDMPTGAVRASLQNLNLNSVIEDDMAFFTQIESLNLSENRLSLELFVCLPSLQEIYFQCNLLSSIGDLPPGSFPNLKVLDLSFNLLGNDCLEKLMSLPKLKQLDLSNNELTAIPSLANFKELEFLSLDRNRLSDVHLLSASFAPKLRKLSMNDNYVRSVPQQTVPLPRSDGGFRMLEELELANNFIERLIQVECTCRYPRLEKLSLHGNPMVDSPEPLTDEEEDLFEAMCQPHADGSCLELVLDPPLLPEQVKRGTTGYRGLNVVSRGESEIPSASLLRQAGNAVLFNTIREMEQQMEEEKQEEEEEEVDTTVPAVTSSVFMTEPDMLGSGDALDCLHSMLHPDTACEEVPSLLLEQKSSAESESGAKLRAAMNSLRHVLKHPATSHSGKSSWIDRPTAAQKRRQLPIRPYEPGKHKAKSKPVVPSRARLNEIESLLDSLNSQTAENTSEMHKQQLDNLADMVKQVMHSL